MSGYEIKKSMEKSIGYFWQESYGQIYPTLKSLLKEGLLKSRTKIQEKGVQKIVYSITKKGEEELDKWLEEDVEFQTYRNELLLKLFFGKKSSVSNSLHHLEKQKSKTTRTLKQYEAISSRTQKAFAKNPNLPFWICTVQYGMEILKAELHWIENTKKEFLKLGK